MSHQRGEKTKKNKQTRVVSVFPKTRHHSNLRPKQKHTKSFLKAYHPYLPLLIVSLLIMSVLQPWKLTAQNSGVLSYATNMSVSELNESTNNARASNKQKPLKVDPKLSKAAQAKAEDMVKVNYWSHNRPDGQEPWVFINDAGYSYTKAGENLAYGFDKSADVVAGWLNSPSHRANILDPSYQDVGFGFANSSNFDDNGPSTVVVAMYGTSSTSSIPLFTDSSTQTADSFSTTLGSKTTNVPQVSISRIQAFTGGEMPWMSYAIGFIIGASVIYLLLHHGFALRRKIKQGEKFVMKHPLLDITLVAVIILGLLVIQSTGIIQ